MLFLFSLLHNVPLSTRLNRLVFFCRRIPPFFQTGVPGWFTQPSRSSVPVPNILYLPSKMRNLPWHLLVPVRCKSHPVCAKNGCQRFGSRMRRACLARASLKREGCGRGQRDSEKIPAKWKRTWSLLMCNHNCLFKLAVTMARIK